MRAIGLLGQAHALDRGDQLAMIDLNCRSLTDLSLRFVDSLARHRGGILNVASISGFIPGPGMSVYNATKAYVISFSEGLRRELRPKGIRVTALCPGPVPTEFQARAGIMDVHYPRGFDRSAEDVARQGYDGLMRGRGIVVPGAHNKLVPWLPRMLPRGFIAEHGVPAPAALGRRVTARSIVPERPLRDHALTKRAGRRNYLSLLDFPAGSCH